MNKRSLFTFGIIGIALISIALALYFGFQYNKIKVNPQALVQEKNTDLITLVGKLIVLPEGEEPTIATVSDPLKLKGQAFFANAKEGDIVLIYAKAKKAILYDPKQNKILEVAPINIDNLTPNL